MDNQGQINEVLCNENCISRFLWKSGVLKNGYAVPWEEQSVNTDPENFLWEKDKTAILIVKGGLYKISLGFYTCNKPSIQVLVNGETALTCVNSTSFIVHHINKMKKPLLTPGITLTDFLMLPEKSRISISFTGEDCIKGFIELKKKH